MSKGALYYPYIHVRDPAWLKGTLLLFDQVQRMVPFPNSVRGDHADILPFTVDRGGKRLLEAAHLWEERPLEAQRELTRKIRTAAGDPAFTSRFGRDAAERLLGPQPYGFQIHQMKLQPALREALGETGLAWEPGTREPWDYGSEYIEVHPQVGEAVMATLAIACAKQDGLEIVADRTGSSLHECLLRKNETAVFDTWLGGRAQLPEPRRPETHELLEYLVTVRCDPSALSADDIAAIGEDRQPLQRLMKRLQESAASIAAMDDRARRQAIADSVSAILAEWRRDSRNLAPFWKRFLGIGLLDEGASFAENVAAGFAKAGVGIGAGATASVIDAGAGLGVGLVVHAAKTAVDVKRDRRESAFRYLTDLERRGVVFRFEAPEAMPLDRLGA